MNGETKERYVGSLADVVGSYLKMKDNSIGGVNGYLPNMGPPGFEPGTTSVLVVGVFNPRLAS